jgi:signal transduction histidine kinase
MRVTPSDIGANRFDTLSRLADDLAHEVKNPLHAMVINLELLRNRIRKGEGEKALARVELIEEEVRRVNTLVEGILQLLRPWKDAGQVHLDRLMEDMRAVLELQAKLARVEFSMVLEASNALLTVRRDWFQHVLLNLISNALAAMPDGGKLEIHTRASNGEVEVSVADTGPGLSQEHFDQATSGELPSLPDGRPRMGLRVAHALLEETGGRLERGTPGVEGRGNSVKVVLPSRVRANQS